MCPGIGEYKTHIYQHFMNRKEFRKPNSFGVRNKKSLQLFPAEPHGDKKIFLTLTVVRNYVDCK